MRKKPKTKYLTTKMIAEKMGFTPDYIRRLCGNGKIKAIRLGHDWMISDQDFEDWLMSREQNKELENAGSDQ